MVHARPAVSTAALMKPISGALAPARAPLLAVVEPMLAADELIPIADELMADEGLALLAPAAPAAPAAPDSAPDALEVGLADDPLDLPAPELLLPLLVLEEEPPAPALRV